MQKICSRINLIYAGAYIDYIVLTFISKLMNKFNALQS